MADAKNTSNEDLQYVLEAFLKAYKPILESELKLAGSAKALLQDSEKNTPSCDDEIELARSLFDKFFTSDVAMRLLPEDGRANMGALEERSWCYRHILCCLIFGWLVCRGPRTYRGFSYYLKRYWRCVREAVGRPVSNPLTAEERRDFATLNRILAKAYAPSVAAEAKSLEYPLEIPGEIDAGEINCHTDDNITNSIFERLLTPEATAALFGSDVFREHSKESIYRLCRCYCICALEFGCCLGRSRTLPQAVRCLKRFFACLRRCFEPLIAVIDAPPTCSSLTFVPACGNLAGIEITGTAAGAGFTSYTLTYSLGGPAINTAVVYPDCSRPPVNSASTTPVNSGILGYLDYTLLPPSTTQATVYLDVFGSGGLHLQVHAVFQFRINAIEITGVAMTDVFVGQDPFDALAPAIKMVKNTDKPGFERSIGGSISVSGSAYAFGCGNQMTQYQLVRSLNRAPGGMSGALPTPMVPNPAGVTGNPLVSAVVYDGTAAHPWSSGCPFSFPTPNTILNGDLVAFWSTEACPVPPGSSVPKISSNATWGSGANGRFVIFLEVDEGPLPSLMPASSAGEDQVVVWLDNSPVVAALTQIGNVVGCGDLRLSDYVNTTAQVKGLAWDYPIDMNFPQQTPNDNFGRYSLSYQKNGGGGTSFLSSDYTPNGAAGTPSVRVPNLWQAVSPTLAQAGVLASWNIVAALDGGPPPDPNQPCVPDASKPWQLPRGCRCAYVIELSVGDTTWVGDGHANHPQSVLFAINIINDIV